MTNEAWKVPIARALISLVVLLAACNASEPAPSKTEAAPSETEAAPSETEAAPSKTEPQPVEAPPQCNAGVELARWLVPEAGQDTDVDGLPLAVGGASDCDYNKFAWRDFLALMRPLAGGDERVFEGFREKWDLLAGKAAYPAQSAVPRGTLVDYLEAGPAPLPLVDTNGEWTYYGQRINATGETFLDGCGLTTANCLRAMTVPLSSSDPPAHPIRFPNQSVEIKEAWKVMGAGDDPARFLTRKVKVTPAKAGATPEAEVMVGLTGFHIVHLTPNNRAWVWATFEHVDNAPDCAAAERLLGGDDHFNYFDPRCVEHCEAKKSNGAFVAATDCPTICKEFNVYHNNGCPLDTAHSEGVTDPPATTQAAFPCGGDLGQTCSTSTNCFLGIMRQPDYYAGYLGGNNCFRADVSLSGEAIASQRGGVPGCDVSIPTQVCRAWPIGFRGVSETGEAKIDETLGPLDAEIRSALRDGDQAWAKVLANYRLVGVQWGVAKPGVDPIWSEEIELEGDPTLINVTLEAYIQGRELPTTREQAITEFSQGTARGGCLACHGTASPQYAWDSFNGVNFRPWRQFHFSHGLDYLEEPQGSGDPKTCEEIVAAARTASAGDPWKLAILQRCPIAPAE
jgi:hypothetical protein